MHFPSMLIIFTSIFLIKYHHLSLASVHPPHQNTTQDRLTLLSIKSSLQDPFGALVSWDNKSLHYCQWHGVVCDRKYPARVSALNLYSIGLVGFLSPHIANLTFLHRINLANNQLHGLIPHELGLLTHLEHLNMEDNMIQGTIPESLGGCLKLKTLSLKNNKLSGHIPPGFGSLRMLNSLELSNNELTGNIFPLSENSSMINYVNISYNNLTGTIPPSLFNYSLKYLDLANNEIGGSIPVSLGSSSSLIFVALNQNSLVGSIPTSLCTTTSSIKYLLLSSNKISGSIPSTLGNCSKLAYIYLHKNNLTGYLPTFNSINSRLEYLSLRENRLSGTITSSLGNNSMLRSLRLIENHFSGTIPESLGRLSQLSVLDLSVNFLTGMVPSSLFNLSSLTFLGLGENRLTGSIPGNTGVTLPNLVDLIMNNNKFDGHIPASLCNASELEIIDLQHNSFSGLVPSNLGSLKNLVEVDVSSNQLEAHDWSFLSSLVNCSLLQFLSLKSNKLKGTLPDYIGNLSASLSYLNIGKNQFSGPLPTGVGNLVGLILLDMNHCHFSGRIPNAIGRLQHLGVLNLGANRFSGPIPPSIGNLSGLFEIYMEENILSSSIPSSMGNLTGLTVLNLSHNLLTGSVPKELVSLFSLTKALDLSYNLLSGPLPMEVSKLINLVQLDISNNDFSRELPPGLGQCEMLQYLHMEGNNFQGKIPGSFANLKSMIVLDLSRNRLTGTVPEFLSSIDSLQFLNLSYNDFQGELPDVGIFRNKTIFSIIGNERLCGGLQMPGLSPCVQKHPLIKGFKRIITIIAAAGLICLAVFLLVIFLKLKREKFSSYRVSSSNDIILHQMVTYRDVAQATDWFSPGNLVGSGSSGSVYKGKLDFFEENFVAVKVFRLQYSCALRSFHCECEALKKLRHRNLVRVITSCSSLDSNGHDFKAIVFEYMHNGSLEEWLHCDENLQGRRPRILNLKQRISIAADVSFALNYLHNEQCSSPIVHCDLKPGNVLLDSDMTAHVSDFGLSKFRGDSSAASSFSQLRGSVGYTPPEYGIGCPVSTMGDVYSYGVLLLEMLTGKRPTDSMFCEGLSLHKYVEMAFPDKLEQILDPRLFEVQDEGTEDSSEIKLLADNSTSEKIIVTFAKISLLCSADLPKERMAIDEVAKELSMIKKQFTARI